MRLSNNEVNSIEELEQTVAASSAGRTRYSVAVEGLIFNDKLEWILLHRGGAARDEVGKFEGIGGRYEGDVDFRTALIREIAEELGNDARVKIVGFVEVKHDRVMKEKEGKVTSEDWVILSFLCKHINGKLSVMEPEKNMGFKYVKDLQIDPAKLSSSAQQSLSSLRENWDKFRALLVSDGSAG